MLPEEALKQPVEDEILVYPDSPANYTEIYFLKQGVDFVINPAKPSIDFFSPKPPAELNLNSAGPYSLEVYSVHNKLLLKKNFSLNPKENYQSIIIPKFLNIGNVLFKKNGQIIDSLPEIKVDAICNENNICEENENGVCPLDCPNSQNPVYPLQTTLVTETPPPVATTQVSTNQTTLMPPTNTFITLVLIFTIGLVVLIVVIGGFYLFRRRQL